MLDKKSFYINGQWVLPTEPRNYKVIDPSNEEPCAEISLAGKKDIDKAVSAAKKAFSTWAFSKKEERLELLEKLYVIYKKRWAEMAKLITLEMGAPMKFSTEMQAATGASPIKSFKNILKDIKFEKDKAIGLLPVNKQSHLRPLATINQVNKSMSILKTKPKIRRSMWSRRAQEYEQKITSGKIYELAEVVRDLNKGDGMLVDQS